MRRIVLFLLSLFLCVSHADAATVYTKVDSSTLKRVLELNIANAEDRVAAAAEYLEQVKINAGRGVTAKGVQEICLAAGLPPAEVTCGKILVGLSNDFRRPCTDHKNASGINGECVKVFKSINVQERGGKYFAEGYLKHKRNINAVCSPTVRPNFNDDYLACRSLDKAKTYFEFQFDDLKESSDSTTANDFKNAIAIIAGYEDADDLKDKTFVSGKSIDKAKCESVNKVAKDFGYIAKQMLDNSLWKAGNYCGLQVNKETKKIVNEYSGVIDNYVYSADDAQTQLQAASSLDESIELYVKSKLGANAVTSFECDKTHWIHGRGAFADADDVLTCRINGKRVDFVFDDLTQTTVLWGSKIIEGSQQGMGCIASGGTFDGERCADLTEELCEQVATLNAKDCPGCAAAYWDTKNKICTLPASASAKNIKTAIRVTTRVGTALGFLAITVATGGTATVIIASATATAAAGVSEGAKLVLDSQSDDWIIEMNQINTPEQAEAFLRKHLNEILGAKDLDPARISALDAMLSKTLAKAPDSYFTEIVSNCQRIEVHPNVTENGENLGDAVSVVYDTTLPTCALNPDNGKNTLQTVVTTADWVELAAGLVAVVASLVQTSKVVTQRAGDVVRTMDDYKHTGWIRDIAAGGWRNQTTGQVVRTLPEGVPGWNPNPNLSGGGRWHGKLYGHGTAGSFTRTRDLTRFFTESSVTEVVSKVWNPNLLGAAANLHYVADGTVNLLNDNEHNVKIPERGGETNVVDTTVPSKPNVEKPEPAIIGGDKPESKPQDNKPEDETVVQQEPSDTVVDDAKPNKDNDDDAGATAVTNTNTTNNSRDVKPFAVQKGPNTALIATAAVAGVVGAGFLIGGLVGRDDDDNKNNVVAAPAPDVTASLNTLMQNANGTFGFINSDGLSLVPLPTMAGTYVPIVLINNKAVAVVKYREHNFPFWVNPSSGLWEPLLGIGYGGGWFNVYQNPSSSGIGFIDSIAGQMNSALSPRTVLYFTKPNDSGAQFPPASPTAYSHINAEFPNGVVQSYDGNALSQSDSLLYNNNYNRIKTMF